MGAAGEAVLEGSFFLVWKYDNEDDAGFSLRHIRGGGGGIAGGEGGIRYYCRRRVFMKEVDRPPRSKKLLRILSEKVLLAIICYGCAAAPVVFFLNARMLVHQSIQIFSCS